MIFNLFWKLFCFNLESPWENPIYVAEVTHEKGLLMVGTLVQQKIYDQSDAGFFLRVFPVNEFPFIDLDIYVCPLPLLIGKQASRGESKFDQNFFDAQQDKEIFPDGLTMTPGNSLLSYSAIYHVPPGKYVIAIGNVEAGAEAKIVVRILNDGKYPAQRVAKGMSRYS